MGMVLLCLSRGERCRGPEATPLPEPPASGQPGQRAAHRWACAARSQPSRAVPLSLCSLSVRMLRPRAHLRLGEAPTVPQCPVLCPQVVQGAVPSARSLHTLALGPALCLPSRLTLRPGACPPSSLGPCFNRTQSSSPAPPLSPSPDPRPSSRPAASACSVQPCLPPPHANGAAAPRHGSVSSAARGAGLRH